MDFVTFRESLNKMETNLNESWEHLRQIAKQDSSRELKLQ